MDNQLPFKSGLRPLKRDRRDYSHSRTFGAGDVSQLPDEYLLVSQVLNQGFSEKCTAYTAAAVQESQNGIPFDPNWIFDQEGIVAGAVSDAGYESRIVMEVGRQKGFKPLQSNDTPDKFKEDGYFYIDGTHDLFDNIRTAMYLAKDEKRCPLLGLMWQSQFDAAPSGIVPDDWDTPRGLHLVKCAGWKKVNGQVCLVIQNSFGTSAGDGGFWYFDRIASNKAFTEAAWMWRIKPDPQQIKTISLILALVSRLISLYRILISQLKGRKIN